MCGALYCGVPFTRPGGIMRAPVCALVVAVGLAAMDLAAMALAAPPAFAQADRTAAAFWKTVKATCDAAAAKPPGGLGKRIAQTAIDEFTSFGGHRIDANGRLFHFGLTEAEHEEDDGDLREAAGPAGASDHHAPAGRATSGRATLVALSTQRRRGPCG